MSNLRGPVPQHASCRTMSRTMRTPEHLGVRIDGKDMGTSVLSYNVREGWARVGNLRTGIFLVHGKIEPYWRS